MKLIVKSCFVLALLFSCNSNLLEQNELIIDLLNDRSFVVATPLDYDSLNTYGLILAFHGAQGSGSGMKLISRFDQLSQNYIVAYPNALHGNWEEGCECNIAHRLGVDDIGFMDQLIDSLKYRFPIDPNRVFAVGYSQGGLFAHNVGCKLSHKVRAFVSVASPMSVPLSQSCQPSQSISVMMIHGTNDAALPYLGEDSGSFSLISSPDAIRIWAAHNDAKSEPIIIISGLNKQIKIEDFSTDSTNQVKLVSIIDGGHNWDFPEFDTSQEILNFFDRLK